MIHFSALGSSQLSWTIRVARRIPVILASIALLSVASIPVTESGTVLLSSAAASPAPPPNLSPMNIRFVPAEFATHYSATVPASPRDAEAV